MSLIQQLIKKLNGGLGRKANRKTKKEMYYEYFEKVEYESFDQDGVAFKSWKSCNAR